MTRASRFDDPGTVRPGDAIVHPLAVLSTIVLLLNDHLLKALAPGWVTGKLSDAAGLIVLGVVLVSLSELAGAPISRRMLAASLAASAFVLVAIKTLPVASEVYAWSLGGMRWAIGGVVDTILGRPTGPLVPVDLVRDASDLLTVPVLIAAWLALAPRCRSVRGPARR